MKRTIGILLFIPWILMPTASAQEPATKTQVENKTQSLEILKTIWEAPLFKIVVLNNADLAIHTFIAKVEEGTVVSRKWESPLSAGDSFVLSYASEAQPSNVSIEAVIFVDGLGEGNPVEIRLANMYDDAWVEGVDAARAVLQQRQPSLRRLIRRSEMQVWLSDTADILDSLQGDASSEPDFRGSLEGHGTQWRFVGVLFRAENVSRRETQGNAGIGRYSVEAARGTEGENTGKG